MLLSLEAKREEGCSNNFLAASPKRGKDVATPPHSMSVLMVIGSVILSIALGLQESGTLTSLSPELKVNVLLLHLPLLLLHHLHLLHLPLLPLFLLLLLHHCLSGPPPQLQVIKCLDVSSLLALSATSKELHTLAQDPLVWKSLLVRDFGRGESSHHVTEYEPKHGMTSWK